MKKLGRLILIYLEPALAIALSIVAAILSVFGVWKDALLPAIAATLALLAASIIRDRAERSALREEVAALHKTTQTIISPDAESILRDRQARYIISSANRAKELWACGYSLITMIRENESYLLERLENGCTIRIMVMNPDSEVTVWLDKLITPGTGELINDIRSSLSRLERVATTLKRGTKSRLEIRLLKTVPTYSIVAVDHNLPDGWVQVGVYPSFHQRPIDTSRPHIVLDRPDGAWYQFFCDQFQMLWSDARYSDPFVLKAASPTVKN